MGECFITRRGGGGTSKAFAVIGVTYPEGSVCTCTDGSKTLKLKDTSGQGFFLIPYTATWTVSATDGTNTKSQSVEITSEGQNESVALSYQLILFDGADNTAITGGWESGSEYSDKVEVNDTIYAKISGTNPSQSYRALCKTVNMISMDACNQLEIVIDDVTKTNAESSWSFGVFKTITSSRPDYIASTTFGAAGTYVLDVSEISDDCYVGFSCGFVGASGRSMAMTASKVIGT